MAVSKEAIALVLDVSQSMVDAPDGSNSSLEKSLEAINMILQRKITRTCLENLDKICKSYHPKCLLLYYMIFSKAKDEVALILFGTRETNNSLAESLPGYENISVARELASPDIELLRMVNENISAGTEAGDFIDAIIVALHHLVTKISGRKLEPRIVLFTNLASKFGADNLEPVVKSMKDRKVQITFVGPEIPEESDGRDDSRDSSTKASVKKGGSKSCEGQESKPLSEQQLKGVWCVRGILEQVDGEGMSFAQVLPMLSFFQARSVKQSTVFRGPLEIGDSLKINMYGYVKAKESTAASFGKISALSEASKNPGDMKVSMQRSNHLQDEEFTEVDKEHVAKAYKYGKTLVPYSKMDEQSLKPQTERCLKVLGFTDRASVNENQFQGESVYFFVPQPGDKDAAIAISAFIHALEEKDMVAVVRYCRCKNAPPKLALLTPVIKVLYEGFYMFILPFAEDIRRFSFPSLSSINISDEQSLAVDAIIDGMDLSKAHRDEDGEEKEAFKPKAILNPSIQRQCQCVQKRALNPDEDDLPDLDGYVKRSIEALPQQAADCKPTVKKLKELFPLNHLDKKVVKDAANVFHRSEEMNRETVGPNNKRSKQADEKVYDFSFASLALTGVTQVGTADPINDYKLLIRLSDDPAFRAASQQLAERILQLVNDSFLDQYYKKALQCLKTLRQESLQRRQVDIFNELLGKIKQSMKGQRRNDFWELLLSEKTGLITRSECHEGQLSENEASKFFESEKEETVDTSMKEEEVEDVDELLDMI